MISQCGIYKEPEERESRLKWRAVLVVGAVGLTRDRVVAPLLGYFHGAGHVRTARGRLHRWELGLLSM